MPACKFPRKLLHVFCFIFSERITITSSKEALKVLRKYKQKKVLLVIYLFNYDSRKSTKSTYGIYVWHLRLSWVRHFSNKFLQFSFRSACMFCCVFFIHRNLIAVLCHDNCCSLSWKFTLLTKISTMKKC